MHPVECCGVLESCNPQSGEGGGGDGNAHMDGGGGAALQMNIDPPMHSGFLKEGDENFQISGHQNIFSRFVLPGLVNGL